MALPIMDFTNAVGHAPNMQDLMGKELENSFNRVRNKYAEPAAIAELKEKELTNRYAPQKAEAEIAMNRAHAGEYGASARKHGAEAQKMEMILPYLQQAFSRMQGGGQNGGQGSTMQQPNAEYNETGMQQPGQQSMQQSQQGMDPFLENMLLEALNLKPLAPFTTSENTYVQPSMFGAPKTTQVGPTERQREQSKAQISANQKAIEKNTDAMDKDISLNYAWDELGNIMKDPKTKDLIGLVKGRTITLGPEKRELEGRLKSTLGRIVLDAAQDIKGAWNKRDQELVNELKPTVTDFDYNVFEGKYKASQLMQRALHQRRQLYSQYLYGGMNQPDAARLAEQQTSLEQLRPQIEKEYGRKKYFTFPDGQVRGISIFDNERLKKAANAKLKEVK